MAARKYRPRKQFKFWLYLDDDNDLKLINYIIWAVGVKKFTQLVRNGLRLIWSLGEGDLSVLFELFPQYRAQLDTHSLLVQQFQVMIEQGAKPKAIMPVVERPSIVAMPLERIEEEDDTDSCAVFLSAFGID